MSLTPEQELRRALAWERFWEIAAEAQVRQAQRAARAARMLDEGHAQGDFEEVDLVLREVDRSMRCLRRAMKPFPELLSEAGCTTEVDELRRQMNRLSASWRDLKSSWRDHDPRPPTAR
jgi:septation ring formation regulator EzrA